MLGPPVVVSRGRPVGGALDVAIVGLPVPARAAATPPVSPVLVHLVVESVAHLGGRERSALRGRANQCKKTGKRPSTVGTLWFLRAFCGDALGKTATRFSFCAKAPFNGLAAANTS